MASALLRDEPWKVPNPGRVKVLRPARVVYGHPDLAEARKFLTAFGLDEIEATPDQKEDEINFAGYDPQPVLYQVRRTSEPRLLRYYFEAASREDLEAATRVPGAGPAIDLNTVGGGEAVDITDPSGLPFGILWGVQKKSYDAPAREVLPFNYPAEEEKPRRGQFQRLAYGRIPVYKLGHCGYWAKDMEESARFYIKHFNFMPSDIMLDPTGKPNIIFFHINLGQEYTDHHSFILGQAGGPIRVGPHHAAFEVESIDHQFIAHEFLLSKGYKSFWGVGRHIEGSQVFDYWFDDGGFLVEHYADGDLVNEDSPVNWVGPREKNSNWGEDSPPTMKLASGPTATPV